jgi:hypothetical protein
MRDQIVALDVLLAVAGEPVSEGRGMTSYEKCMGHAQECVRLAGLTSDMTVRDQVLDLARGWIRIALSARDSAARVIEFPRVGVFALSRA